MVWLSQEEEAVDRRKEKKRGKRKRRRGRKGKAKTVEEPASMAAVTPVAAEPSSVDVVRWEGGVPVHVGVVCDGACAARYA